LASAGAAEASSGIDSPDSGVVQMGRGSAWVARADDPLAFYFNPAAMAFQATSVHVGAQLLMQKSCFTRLGTNGQPVAPGPGIDPPILAGQANPADGALPPQDKVCTPGSPFPVPQIAAVFRVADRVAIGVGVVTPHASGANSYPESLSYTNAFGATITQPSPQRYLLVSSNALIVYPTVSVAYAPLENLSFGAGFVWGIGTVDFVTFAETLSTAPGPGMTATDHAVNDARAELKAKDLFMPGVVLSAMWMPTQNLDVAAWFKWQDALSAPTDLTLTSEYWQTSGARQDNAMLCASANKPAGCNVVTYPGVGHVNFQIPMEAKLGLRYHHPRQDVTKRPGWASTPGRKVRDPMSEDLFDIELDFTWANNSAVQDLGLTFHSTPPVPNEIITKNCIATSGGCIGGVPATGSIPHNWKDVVGIRLGGDFVAVPNLLSLRAGGFYETQGQDASYLNLDFDVAQKIGASGGATVRLGPVDVSVAYAHTFYGTLNNGGNGKIYALSGDNTGASLGACGSVPATNPTPSLPGCFRSYQPVNGGILTSQLNEVGLSGTMHF
jgi:long-chain fatty acid transport protein